MSRRLAVLSLAALVLVAGLVWLVHVRRVEARILRGDPDVVAATPALMAFAEPRGRRVFDEHCAACHGAAGKGDSAKGVPNLADNDWLYGDGLAADIEQVVSFGIRAHAPHTWNLAEMPAYAEPVPTRTEKLNPLTPGEIGDLTELIVYMGGGKAEPLAMARGSKLFQDKGGCYDCHGSDGHGDPAIGAPNLTDKIWLYGDGGRASIFRSIAHGHHGVCPAWIKRLRPAAIREVALYIHTISHPTPATDKTP